MPGRQGAGRDRRGRVRRPRRSQSLQRATGSSSRRHAPAVHGSQTSAPANVETRATIEVVDVATAASACSRRRRRAGSRGRWASSSAACRRPASTAASRTDDVKRFQTRPAPSHARHAPVAIAHRRRSEERIPLRGMRKRIAETMARSVHTAAHFTYVEEIDMTELVARARAREDARRRARRASSTTCRSSSRRWSSGLKKWPMLNASARRGDAGDRPQALLPHRDRGAGPAGPRGVGRARRRPAARSSIFARDRSARRGRAHRHGDARRADRLDVHDQLARQARRRARDADHQLPRGRDPGRPQDRGAAGGARRPDRRRAT